MSGSQAPTTDMQASEAQPSTQLQHQPRLRRNSLALALARLLWVVVAALAIVVFTAKLVTLVPWLLSPSPDTLVMLEQAGLSLAVRAAFVVVMESFLALVCFAVGVLLVRYRSDHLPALLASTTFFAFGAAGGTLEMLAVLNARWVVPVALLGFTYRTTIVIFLCIFPDGRFVPPWTKWVAVVWSFMALHIVFPFELPVSLDFWPPQLGAILSAILFALIFYAQIYRYRHTTSPVERAQTRWVAYGIAVTLVVTVVLDLLQGVIPELREPTVAGVTIELIFLLLWDLALALIPLTVGIAILRNKLYGIDIIIRRTLVYVPLTAILAGMFAAAAFLARKAILALTGRQSDVAVLVATLVVAGAFEPIKQALKRIVDARFRDPPDSAAKLAALRDQVHNPLGPIDPVLGMRRLLEAGIAAFEAGGGAAYGEVDGGLRLLATVGNWSGDTGLSVDVESAGSRWGQVVLGARRNGDTYSSRDHQLMLTTAEALATALAVSPAGTLGSTSASDAVTVASPSSR